MPRSLTAIRETNALAVHATPELQQVFSDWLKEIERKAEAAISQGEKEAGAIASQLNVTEDSARYILNRLTQQGKITLSARPVS